MMRLTGLALPLLLLCVTAAHADDLDVDLSKPDVRLNVSFKGSELLLFGAKDIFGDVIVVVRGPNKDTSVRLKEKVFGIWASTDEVIFSDTPTFYAVAATQPVQDLLPEHVLQSERIGATRLGLKVKSKPPTASAKTIDNFNAGFIRNMVAKNLYAKNLGNIRQIGKQLFRTELWFPSNVSVGEYIVETYLVLDGQIETKRTTYLRVHKVGIEAQVYDFAHNFAFLYGLLAIIIAMVSGWSANAIFMKRGR